MSLRGPEAMASLDEALRDIRREEDEIAKRLARSGERITKIHETEADLVRQLAKLRLDPAIQAELADHISSAEAKARDMLKAHASEMGGAEKELAAIDASLGKLTSDRAEALTTLAGHQEALKALATSVQATLATDSAYAALAGEARQLNETAAQSMQKTEQAEADREQKGRPYRDDPLFMYLWESGYGTKNYRSNNLIRYLDGLVAGLVDFAKARPNFAMLNEIPLRLREHAERQMAIAAEARAKAEAMQTAAVDAAGGKPVRDKLTAVQGRIDAIDAQITEAEDKRDAAAKSLSVLAQGADPAFEQALTTLAESLQREDITTLLNEARLTSTGRDDTLVAQIDDARTRARDEDTETKDQRERLKTLAARRRELEDIQWEFKKSRFDDPRSSFGEDKLVGDLLNDFLRGGITAASYWEQWRRSQNFNQGTSWGNGGVPSSTSPWAERGGSTVNWPKDSFGGGGGNSPGLPTGMPGGWGRSSGGNSGGFSRPRTGSQGGRGSDTGFKTGGGF
ncbi:hypothetical protein [Devosia sp.]|uniref:hypothetical protein n=1 Tax=Devosia sp. TaxID=1871048 RepID=UPI003265BCB4